MVDATMSDAAPAKLSILHVMRAPVGGLFRHVIDLARAQSERGHRVGIVADSTSGGASADAKLADLTPTLAFGVTRVPMSRQIGASDVAAVRPVAARAAEIGADVLHGHGAKGGAYARLARHRGAIRAYTPHGGSLHYRWGTPAGFFYLSAERALMRRTDLFLFESAYGRDAFIAKIGDPGTRARVVHNGVTDAEFDPIPMDPAARDLVFIGELRVLKGVDVLLRAVAGSGLSVAIVGDGPDRAVFEADAVTLGLKDKVQFLGAMPARQGFALGRALVIPSRAESLPYIVLEAAAAGMPLIATAVGGMAEIFGPDADKLAEPDDAAALRRAIETTLNDPDAARQHALRLQARVRAAFSADTMTDAVLTAYREALRLQRAADHG
jgi:glycosyltransferase involved in cell wall biosynthesis